MISFDVRGRRVSAYALMLYVGLVVALVVLDVLAARLGLPPARVLAAAVVIVPFLLAGARALAVALHWSHFRGRPGELGRVEHGGAAMYGGLPPALLVSVPLLRWLDVPLGAFWDLAAVAILAGMVPTRLGCLASGCCAGRPTRGFLGLCLANARGERRRRLPSPLFEAALGAALLVVVALVWDLLPFEGAAFLLALGGYGAGRFLLEGLREDRGPLVAGVGVLQWTSLGLAVVSAVLLTAGWMEAGHAGAAVGLAGRGATGSTGPATVASLALSVLLLAPVLYLFRFLGCALFLGEIEDPEQQLQLGAVVPPAAPPEEFTVTMALVDAETGDEADGSPFDLEVRPALPDGNLVFEVLATVTEGAYDAVCSVAHPDLVTRLGSCSGELGAPGLSVIFVASPATAPNVILPFRCFEPPPSS